MATIAATLTHCLILTVLYPMSVSPITICPSDRLENGGLAYKVSVIHAGHPATALFVRYQDTAFGFLNRCPHQGSELDWENSVFTRAGDRLMCARHGATFMPDTGECTGGPCQPSRLVQLQVSEADRDGVMTVWWHPDGTTMPCA